MQKKLTLSIPEPCHENWNNMQLTEQGRFCSSCQKEVIDFTGMTDKELYNYFTKKNSLNVCGMAHPFQLNTAITKPIEPKKKKLWYISYLTTLFLFINKSETKAQQGKATVTISPTHNSELMGKIRYIPPPQNSGSIVGKVVDKEGNPVAFASVRIKNTKEGTQTDRTGHFSVKAQAAGDSFVEISSVGYEQKLVPFTLLRQDTTVVLTASSQLLGEVVVVGYNTRRVGMLMGSVSVVKGSGFIKKMADTISGKNVFKIYPDPVLKGSVVNVDMKGVAKGDYQLQLMDAAGSIIQEDRISVPGKQFVFQLPVKTTTAAGTYFLRVIDPKNKLAYKGKLVVL